MSMTTTAIEPAVRTYARLLRKLHSLIARNADESPEGEAMRDEMDGLWQTMSKTECERMNGLSQDLYARKEGKDRRIQMDDKQRTEWEQDLQKSAARGDFDRVLVLLRSAPNDLTIRRVWELTRDCWEKLGDFETASAF